MKRIGLNTAIAIGKVEKGLQLLRQKMAPKGTPAVFMHIPKCAGSSFLTAWANRNPYFWAGYVDGPVSRKLTCELLGISERSQASEDLLYRFRQMELLKKAKLGCRELSGHVPLSAEILRSLKPDYRLITLVREPVGRWVSSFSFRYLHGTLPAEVMALEVKGAEAMLELYIKTEDCRTESEILLDFFLGGLSTRNRGSFDHALENASQFDLIGDAADFEAFIQKSSSLLNRSLSVIRTNVTHEMKEERRIPIAEMKASIRERADIIQECFKKDIEWMEHLITYLKDSGQGTSV